MNGALYILKVSSTFARKRTSPVKIAVEAMNFTLENKKLLLPEGFIQFIKLSPKN